MDAEKCKRATTEDDAMDTLVSVTGNGPAHPRMWQRIRMAPLEIRESGAVWMLLAQPLFRIREY